MKERSVSHRSKCSRYISNNPEAALGSLLSILMQPSHI